MTKRLMTTAGWHVRARTVHHHQARRPLCLPALAAATATGQIVRATTLVSTASAVSLFALATSASTILGMRGTTATERATSSFLGCSSDLTGGQRVQSAVRTTAIATTGCGMEAH